MQPDRTTPRRTHYIGTGTCLICGAPTRLRSDRVVRFCSRACMGIGQSIAVNLLCATCGESFTRPPSRVVSAQSYCSDACARARFGRPVILNDDGLTAKIPLCARDGTVRTYAIIDAADAEWAGQWRWHSDHGYAARGERAGGRRTVVYLHRELLGLPRIKDDRQGDHKDLDTLNCCRSNLRILTNAENRQNLASFRGSSSSYRGVFWNRKDRRWIAAVKVGGQRVYLGSFTDELEAAEAARAARTRLMPYAID